MNGYNGIEIRRSFESGLTKVFDYLPQLLAAILLVLVGYLIAKVLEKTVRRALNKMRFDRALLTSPAGNVVGRMMESPTRFVGSIAFWLVYLAFVSFAVSALNLPVLNHIMTGIYSYVPRVIAAVAIFLVASAVSASTVGFVQRVMGKTPTAKLVTAVVPAVTMSISIFMILNELDIAKDIVNITYTAIMGAMALGLALSFGLGGRDAAKAMIDQAYETTRQNTGRIKRDVNVAKANVRQEAAAVRTRAKTTRRAR